MKKQISILLVAASVLLLFSSCKKDATGKDLWYPLDGNVSTLDPQCASTADELLIVQNLMEGLVRQKQDGSIIPGLAESWSISEDGLTYTFRLRRGVKWDLTNTQKNIYKESTTETAETTKRKKNKKAPEASGPVFDPEITAEDFVFALQRACLPNTNAPFFSSIASIAGASAVHSGQAAASSLGVTAPDDYTVRIVLSQPDNQLLATLTTAIAMPCNKEYFEYTKGRYGLNKQNTLVNGPFFLSSWEKTKVILKRSELYTGEQVPSPASITLHVPEDRNNILPNLLKGVYDAAILSGRDSLSISEQNGVTLTPYERTVWGYLFNCKDTIMANEQIRKALCYAFQAPDSADTAYLKTPEGLIPASCGINGTAYRTLAGSAPIAKNDPDAAAKSWLAGLKVLAVSEMELTILCTEEMEQYVKQGVQGLQKTLGSKINYVDKDGNDKGLSLTIKIETATEADFSDRLKTGTFQIAFCSLEAEDDSAAHFLNRFRSGGGYANFQSASYDQLMEQANQTLDAQAMADFLKQGEAQLLEHAVFHPVFAEDSYFAMAKGVSDLAFRTSGGKIDFINGKRLD